MVRPDALSQLAGGYALRTDRFRLVVWGEGGTEGVELYDHSSDPHELTNLADSQKHAETVAELKRRISESNRRCKEDTAEDQTAICVSVAQPVTIGSATQGLNRQETLILRRSLVFE